MQTSQRTWLILLAGFGSLLVLIVLSALAVTGIADSVYQQTSEIQRDHFAVELALSRLRSDIFLGSIHLRDFLLDPSGPENSGYLDLLQEARNASRLHLKELRALSSPPAGSDLDRFERELEHYWESMNPVFAWQSAQATPFEFVEREVLPRRRSLLRLAEQIQEFHGRNYRDEQQLLEGAWARFQSYHGRVTLAALLLGLLSAGLGIRRMIQLERAARNQQARSDQAERELRKLSNRLVRTQEDERRALSRELHDQIGQMLTALRLEIGNLGKIQEKPKEEFQARTVEAKQLAERTLRVVRDLAMGLRPSMLDDLGLEPALRWLAREFSRRSEIEADVRIEGALEDLTDERKTCLFRVVQESLTNCARHSKARRVKVRLQRSPREIRLNVQDDGCGFDVNGVAGKGIGLLGMEERVRELGGALAVVSAPGRGTQLEVRIPLEVSFESH